MNKTYRTHNGCLPMEQVITHLKSEKLAASVNPKDQQAGNEWDGRKAGHIPDLRSSWREGHVPDPGAPMSWKTRTKGGEDGKGGMRVRSRYGRDGQERARCERRHGGG